MACVQYICSTVVLLPFSITYVFICFISFIQKYLIKKNNLFCFQTPDAAIIDNTNASTNGSKVSNHPQNASHVINQGQESLGRDAQALSKLVPKSG